MATTGDMHGTLQHDIETSASQTRIVHTEVDDLAAALDALRARSDYLGDATENDGSVDVWGGDADADESWRINVRAVQP